MSEIVVVFGREFIKTENAGFVFEVIADETFVDGAVGNETFVSTE